MNKIFFACLFTTLMSACSPSQQEVQQEEDASSLPTDFNEFYEAFHTDSIFQMSRIQWPLRGLRTTDEGPNVIRGYYYHQREDWLMHRSVDPNAGFIKHIYPIGEDMIEELLTDAKGDFGMKRRFAKLGNEWYLIFYSGMNHIAR